MLSAYQASQLLFPSWVRGRLLAPGLGHDGHHLALGLPREFLALLEGDAEADRPDNVVSLAALRLFLGERCLRDTDTMSMAVSLEVRSAFTDHCFLEQALSVPAALRCQGSPHKPFLRRLFERCLGEDFPQRKKQGFRLPLEAWLRDRVIFDRIQGTLTDRNLLHQAGFVPAAVNDMLAAYERGRPPIPWSRVWALYVFLQWCRRNRVSR